ISSLSWIHTFGAGVDSFMKLDNLSNKTVISRTTGKLGHKIGEYCLTYILLDIKNVHSIYRNQAIGHWEQLYQQYLDNQKVLILGTGHVGKGIAGVLKGRCATISGLSRSLQSCHEFDRMYSWQDLEDLDKEYDIIINTLPNTQKTFNIIDNRFFSHFRNIHFINVGRGETVNEDDLLRALESGFVRRATLDVFKTEPLPESSALWDHDKIVITPHQSGITDVDDVISSFDQAYQGYIKGDDSSLYVNKKEGY
ncbi:MAG: NAD(P)-dependent oxidoreductase, partial [Bacteroidota bacterium]